MLVGRRRASQRLFGAGKDAAFPEAAVVVILLHVKYSIPYHSVRSLAAMLPFM